MAARLIDYSEEQAATLRELWARLPFEMAVLIGEWCERGAVLEVVSNAQAEAERLTSCRRDLWRRQGSYMWRRLDRQAETFTANQRRRDGRPRLRAGRWVQLVSEPYAEISDCVGVQGGRGEQVDPPRWVFDVHSHSIGLFTDSHARELARVFKAHEEAGQA